VSTVQVQIFDKRTRVLVDATLHTELSAATLIDVEAIWGPARIAAVQQRMIVDESGGVGDVLVSRG
jgi:hypothetical protein